MFALDVSNPEGFGNGSVLWELNSSVDQDIGHVYGRPLLLPLENDRWGVLFGNGYGGNTSDPSLYVVDANNQVISRIAQADPTAPQDITTTFDKNLQIEAQKALLGFRGAIVVMEVDTGRVLAMASYPTFDNRWFEAGLSSSKFQQIFPSTKPDGTPIDPDDELVHSADVWPR
mgnify:CR=1 FL=1